MSDPYTNTNFTPAFAPAPKKTSNAVNQVLIILITAVLTFAITASIGTVYLNAIPKETVEVSPNVLSFDSKVDTAAAVAKFREAYNYLDENYYQDLTDAQIIEAMTSGMIDQIGSRYTMYLSAEENSSLTESMSGEYVGIGAMVSMNKNNYVEITEVIANSPAAEAGIQVGDIFVKVDDTDVSTVETIEAVAALVKGTAGTKVKLVMYRPSESRDIELTVTRRRIEAVSVTSRMLNATTGYVQIREFSVGVSKKFKAAVDSMIEQGATNIVFDLRNNSGGLANEVIDMLDYLLPETTIATIKGRKDGKPYEVTWDSEASMGVPADMRYAILINDSTASASELFSGCLRDLGKAVLIGEKSFGKGSGTQTYELDDGSAINVTTFLYYLPGGDCIEEIGLTPAVEVSLPAEAASLSIYQLTPEQDTQLAAAISNLANSH